MNGTVAGTDDKTVSRRHRKSLEPRVNGTHIPAIDSAQRGLVCAESERCIATGSRLFSIPVQAIPIRFDLSGRAAGQFTLDLRNGQCGIR